MQEDPSEADGEEHVGGDDTEGNCTGNQAAVHLEFVHHANEWRDEERNEGDVNGDQVLAHHAHDEDAANDSPFGAARNAHGARCICVAHAVNDCTRKQGRKPRVGNGHGEGAEQCVREGDLRAAGEAGLESDHRARDTHSSDKSGDNRGDKERDYDVHSGKAQSQHDDHREDDCIQQKHDYSKKLCVKN